MGKFNQKKTELTMEDDGIELGVDWQKLMADFQVLSVEDAMKNIMSKVMHLNKSKLTFLYALLNKYNIQIEGSYKWKGRVRSDMSDFKALPAFRRQQVLLESLYWPWV